MELILVRHGQAEKKEQSTIDKDRVLTKQGARKINKIAKALKRYLPQDSKLVIWSSPMTRSVQTAGILAKAWGREVDKVLESIGTGDFKSLVAEWSRLNEDELCLVVVGHEPYLSNWSSQICGLPLPFKKGSAAGFRITSTKQPGGKLLWFVQAAILEGRGVNII